MKVTFFFLILFFLTPLSAGDQAVLHVKFPQLQFSSNKSGISLNGIGGTAHLNIPLRDKYSTVQLMNPFSSGEAKDGRKSWKWIGFGTLQAAAWAAVFHCGAPKLSVPVLLAASYVFLF